MSTTIPRVVPTDALVQLSFRVQAVLAAVGAGHDLSIVQMRLLGVLRDREPSMAELGLHLGLDKSSISGLVSRAQHRGLVQRHASPDDGRSVLVSLTTEGRRLADRGTVEVEERLQELTGRLSEQQRRALSAVVKALV